MNHWTRICALLLGLMLAGGAQAQRLEAMPGYVDFGRLSDLSDTPPKVEVTLSGVLLQFFAVALEEEDADLAQTLGKLASIRVSVFDLEEHSAKQARQEADRIASKLTADAWERTVLVRDEESTVHMFIKTANDAIAGMTVMVVEPSSEAVFINIVGEIDPAQLGRVASKFGVSLNDMDF